MLKIYIYELSNLQQKFTYLLKAQITYQLQDIDVNNDEHEKAVNHNQTVPKIKGLDDRLVNSVDIKVKDIRKKFIGFSSRHRSNE